MGIFRTNWMGKPRAVAGLMAVSVSLLFLIPQASAQEGSADPEIQNVENVLEKSGPSTPAQAPVQVRPTKPPSTIDFSRLKNNRHYSDRVVIQRTYMPKTGRVQIFGGLTAAVNDVFFRTMGGQLRAAYHFNETWGLEGTGLFLSSSETQTIKDLAQNQRLGVENLTTPVSMYGVNVYFNGIYGKMALEDRKIIPFEFYQTLGVGQVNTKPASNSTAFYFGLGNLFSISKNSAIRADLSWIFYNGKTVNGDTQSANTIFFTIGYGRFVPEAGRR